MHSSRMCTTHSSGRPGGFSTRHPPGTRPHEQAGPLGLGTPLRPGIPLGPGTPLDQAPPVTRHPKGAETLQEQTPPPPRSRHTPPRPGTPLGPGNPLGPGTLRAGTPLWTEFLTHASENITWPQISFTGGN